MRSGLQDRQRLDALQPCKELGLILGAVGSHRRICIGGRAGFTFLERLLVVVFEEMGSGASLGRGDQ